MKLSNLKINSGHFIYSVNTINSQLIGITLSDITISSTYMFDIFVQETIKLADSSIIDTSITNGGFIFIPNKAIAEEVTISNVIHDNLTLDNSYFIE